jgi:hypothetical protein
MGVNGAGCELPDAPITALAVLDHVPVKELVDFGAHAGEKSSDDSHTATPMFGSGQWPAERMAIDGIIL